MPDVRLSLAQAEDLVAEVLQANGASRAAARATAVALVAAEADGQAAHGLSRVSSYALQARSGKVNGTAVPVLTRPAPAVIRVDAGLGFAYPAIDLAIEALIPTARTQGIALAAICHSHHFGQVGAHAERLAAAGLVALVFGNTPKAMAFYGGRAPMLGTNPLAFAAPLPSGDAPLVIDLALSVAARGKIIAAQKANKPIPDSWAVDAEGQPTTDPTAALAGTLAPIGGAKGGALALMVEILGAALTAGAFGWEATSFFESHGKAPDMGHLFIAIDPGPASGNAFAARMSVLAEAMRADPAVRLPGSRRLTARKIATQEGLRVPATLHAEIRALLQP
ncbi:MAG: Ldh family oxidoreductase [Gammaproteobacteria bacterium]|nr:Ldh family oxidoreductase [Gammaproteobacteria bacterium]